MDFCFRVGSSSPNSCDDKFIKKASAIIPLNFCFGCCLVLLHLVWFRTKAGRFKILLTISQRQFSEQRSPVLIISMSFDQAEYKGNLFKKNFANKCMPASQQCNLLAEKHLSIWSWGE